MFKNLFQYKNIKKINEILINMNFNLKFRGNTWLKKV